MSTTSGAPRTVSIDELVRKADPGVSFTPTQRLGYNVFRLLLFVGAVLLTVFIVYMIATYPRYNDIVGAVSDNGDKATALKDAKVAWGSQVKDMGQFFFVTPIVTLLGTVLGYMFGAKDTEHS